MSASRAGAKPRVVGTSPLAFIDAGHDQFLPVEKILMVLTPKGRESRRLREAFGARGMLLDFTSGERTASMWMLVPGGYLVLSPRSVNAVINAMNGWYFEKKFGPKGRR